MKRISLAIALAVVAFFAATALEVLMYNAILAEVMRGIESEHRVVSFVSRHSDLLEVAVFPIVHFTVGAAVGWALRARPEALAVALTVGIAAPLSTLHFAIWRTCAVHLVHSCTGVA